MVPSAGVGTCFSRRALMELAAETNNQPFNTDTLTEDYDIGARLAQRGMRQIFGKFPVEYVARRRSWFGLGPEKVTTLSMPLGVREYFPNTFRTAYRQKARWTLGIGLQGWQQVGWTGSFATRYLLFRDRKGLVTSFIAILAYLLLANFFLFYLADRFGWWTVYYPSYFRPGGWLVTLMWLNAVALLLRVVQRMYFVGNMYGWEHAVLSVPRMIVGNFINAMAARAWKLFIGHLITGKRLAWDKTMHDFPSTDQLAQQRQRLGELLLSWQAIDEDKLAQALEIQARDKKPLGTILLEQGWLDAGTLKPSISNKARKRKPRPDHRRQTRHPMTPLTRTLVLSAALACLWTGAPAAAQQAARAAEAPLEGAAWQFANEGYRLYDAGRYAQAQQQAESAIALRPDVERLRLLLIYALQKQGKLDEAERAADDAVKNGLDTPALRQARANLRPATPAAPAAMRVRPAPARRGAPATTSAYRRGFPIATRAYADYNSGNYPAAQRGAEQAFRIDPKQGAWAMLWLDALEAQGKYAEAETAANQAMTLGAPNQSDLAARRATMKRRMAVKPAEQGYQALIANRPGDAVRWRGSRGAGARHRQPPPAADDRADAGRPARGRRGRGHRRTQAGR